MKKIVPPDMQSASIAAMALSDPAAPSSTVLLTLRANKLKDMDVFSKSDPLCVVYILEGRLGGRPAWRELGRTEMILNCLNPEWAKQIPVCYLFEERQTMRFDIYDIDNNGRDLSGQDFLGTFQCDLAEIVNAEGGRFTGILKGADGRSGKYGTLTIAAEEMDGGGAKEVVQLHCHGTGLDKKDFFGKSDPFLCFYRYNEDRSMMLAHRTEYIKKTLNPVWQPFEMNAKLLCHGNHDEEFLVQCWDWDYDGGLSSSHDFIGECRTTLRRLLEHTDIAIPLINPEKARKKGKRYQHSGVLHFDSVRIQRQFSFLDFITGGTQLDFVVSVDFTASNGNVSSPNSLHYLSPGYPNQYEVAIRAIIEICQHYNNSKRFDAFGFGAKTPPHAALSHLFPLNLESSPTVIGLEGVLNAYRRSLCGVQLYGPTNFAPTINEVARKTSQLRADGSRYQILLIITDGVITDMAQTKRAIIAASSLPLSIIIIGVGNDSFESMVELDSDDALLSFEGRTALRDIVQFVPMRNFLNTNTGSPDSERLMSILAKEVLAEVPEQLTGYMRSRGIAPPPADNPFPRDPPPVSSNNQPVVYNNFDNTSFGGAQQMREPPPPYPGQAAVSPPYPVQSAMHPQPVPQYMANRY